MSGQDRKRVANDRKAIYRAATVEQAIQQLDLFRSGWDRKYPTIALLWQRHGEQMTPFFAFPPEIRRVIYPTHAVESLHRSLRKISKTRGAFPSEEAALKWLSLALRNVTQQGGQRPGWKAARNHFALLWDTPLPERRR